MDNFTETLEFFKISSNDTSSFINDVIHYFFNREALETFQFFLSEMELEMGILETEYRHKAITPELLHEINIKMIETMGNKGFSIEDIQLLIGIDVDNHSAPILTYTFNIDSLLTLLENDDFFLLEKVELSEALYENNG